MHSWRDTGFLLTSRRHGETAAIIEVFTPGHGRHLGVVPGGASRRMAPVLQPGTQLDLTWSARLDEHLGNFRAEPQAERASALMADRLALAGLGAVCALLSFALPERQPHTRLYALSVSLLDAMVEGADWMAAYVLWERMLLEDLGFGLQLDSCAVSAEAVDLVYVSPRTGRAVGRRHAGEWADRLLPLPRVLAGEVEDRAGVPDALRTTGHFLAEHLAPALGDRPLPPARARLIAAIERQLRQGGVPVPADAPALSPGGAAGAAGTTGPADPAGATGMTGTNGTAERDAPLPMTKDGPDR